MKKILFPGSFDPITKAHLNIIKRLNNLGYEVCVAILNNSSKNYYFEVKDRLNMIELSTKELQNISVISSNELLINVCKEQNIKLVARGLRNSKDYEYEKEMEFNNKLLNENLEYLYLNTDQKYMHISSSIVRELLKYNKNPEHLLENNVNDYIITCKR